MPEKALEVSSAQEQTPDQTAQAGEHPLMQTSPRYTSDPYLTPNQHAVLRMQQLHGNRYVLESLNSTNSRSREINHNRIQREYRADLGTSFQIRANASITYRGSPIENFSLSAQHQRLQLPANTSGTLRLEIHAIISNEQINTPIGHLPLPYRSLPGTTQRDTTGVFEWQVAIDAAGTVTRGALTAHNVSISGSGLVSSVTIPARVSLTEIGSLGNDQIGCHLLANRTDNVPEVSWSHGEEINHDFRITIEPAPKTVRQNKEAIPLPPSPIIPSPTPPIIVPDTLLRRFLRFNREGRTTLSDGTGQQMGQFDNEIEALNSYIVELRTNNELWAALNQNQIPVLIAVTGYSSFPGTPQANERVSLQRAENVANILRARIPIAHISPRNQPAVGPNRNLDGWSPEMREEINQGMRAVEIQISRTNVIRAISAVQRERQEAAQLSDGQIPQN